MEKKETQFKGSYYYGLGRRKEAIARVRLYKGSGKFIVNDMDLDKYVTSETMREKVFGPFDMLGFKEKFDVSAKVSGGGKSGQLDAIRHGIARAILASDESLKVTLRRGGFLTRDPRVKERKKYGLKRARKAPQFSKR